MNARKPFGSGGAAYVLEADPPQDRVRAEVRESHAVTDGSFADDVVMPAGGSVAPSSQETVADTALDRSGYSRADIDFVAVTHMKRSFHQTLLSELGVDPDEDSYYLDEFGHMQSVDQVVALHEGLESGRVQNGDVVLFLAAGTGYTWAATVPDWVG